MIYRVERVDADNFYWPVRPAGALENEDEAVMFARWVIEQGAHSARVVLYTDDEPPVVLCTLTA